jgi:hypothetical protein
VRRRNTDWLSGVCFIDLKIRVGLEFMTSRLRTWPYWVNGFFNLLPEDGVWQTLLRKKRYLLESVVQLVWKHGDSHFWLGLMAMKKFFFRYGSFSINDGAQIRFWEDKCW